MKKEKISEQLDSMVGKQFIYNEEHVTIIRHRMEGDAYVITTDVKDITIGFGDIKEKIKGFLPVEENKSMIAVAERQQLMHGTSFGPDILKKLRDNLLDNIEKVKTNKEYIPQAQEIKAQVDSIIDLAKTEIDMMKTVHIISR